MAGKFVISKRSNGDFQFNLKAGNGQVILASQGYADKAGCKNGIESVKKNGSDKARYVTMTAKDGSPYFVLKAGNGQVIGQSQMYSGEAACAGGVESCMNNAPGAAVDDQTAH